MRSTSLTTRPFALRLAGPAVLGAASCLAWLAAALLPNPAFTQQSDRPPGWSEATHTKEAAPDYRELFSTDRVHELHIAIAPQDFAAMQADLQTLIPGRGARPAPGAAPDLTPRDPIYVPATVTYDGRTWPGVGIRYKGNSSLMMARSRGGGKIPFRLDFDRYEDEVPGTRNQRFFGFHKLTFSSNYSDSSMLREVLATELFRDRGVPAARAAFYRVYIDSGSGDEYWGLYTMIEDPADGAMLDAQFGSRDGNLYKPSGPGASWTMFDERGFPKKTNEKSADFSDIEGAISALHASQDDPATWRMNLEAHFDVDGFLRWLAVNTVIANWDSYGRMAHNYYLYGDPAAAGRLSWIPWDHNMSFATVGGGIRVAVVSDSIRSGIGGVRVPPPGSGSRVAPVPRTMAGFDDPLHRNVSRAWPLISRVMADEVYARRYRELLAHAVGGLAEPKVFEARARELLTMVLPYVVGEEGEGPNSTSIPSQQSFLQSLDGPNGLVEQFKRRREQVLEAL